MSIKKKLQLSILVTGGIAFLFFGLILAWTSQHMGQAHKRGKVIDQVVKGVFELNVIIDDYLLYRAERAQMQWRLRYDSLAQLLTDIEVKDPEERAILDQIGQNHAEIQPLFSQLVTNYESRSLSEAEAAPSLDLEQRLVSQLSLKVQTMVADTFRLAETTRVKIDIVERRTSFLLIILGGFAGISVLANIVLTRNRIVAGIMKLHQGAEIIAAGNLDYQVDADSHDELGALAQAFNAMTRRLRESYTALEQEIAERKRAEAALQESESTLRSFFDSTPLMMGIVELADEDILHISDNTATARFFGTTPEAMRRRLGSELGAPRAVILEWLRHYRESERTGRPVRFEYSYGEGDDEKWLSATVSLIPDVSGAQPRLCYVVEDITERKRMEAALRTAQEQLQRLLSASPVVLYSLKVEDEALIPTWVSANISRMMGYTVAETLQPNWFAEHLHPDDRQQAFTNVSTLFAQGELAHEYRFLLKNGGTYCWIRNELRLLSDSAGQPVEIVGSWSDITARKQVEEALRESEERFRRIFAEAPIGIEIYDAAGQLLHANQACLDIFGVADITEVQGFNLFGDPNLSAEVKETLRQGETVKYEAPFDFGKVQEFKLYETTRSGLAHLDTVITPLKGEETPFGYLVLVQDITERKRAEQRVAEALEFNQAILETAPLGINTYYASGQCVSANEAAAQIIGAARDQVLEQNFRHIESWRKSGLLDAAEKALASGGPQQREIHAMTTFGQEVWLDCRLAPFAAGNESHLLLIFGDVTDRKRAQEALAQKAEELARSNAELEQFAHVASHDLQEPLRMVASYVQLLARRYQGQLDADEFIAYAVDGANRMRRLINDLLAYSRVGTRGKEFAPMDGQAVLEQALTNLHVAIEDSGAVVIYDPLPAVTADDGQLVQLFQNLIGNALKFGSEAPPGRSRLGAASRRFQNTQRARCP